MSLISQTNDQEEEFQIDIYKWKHSDFIGKGAFGKVYKGVNTETQQVVAVKELNKSLLKSQKGRDSIQSEIQILTQFQNPNIVQLYYQEINDERAIMVMEMCRDGDLREYLNKNNKKLSEQEAIQIIKQLMNGFKEITDKGFIHRDVKPENALKNDNVFKVADFGFAKQISIKNTNEKIKEFIGTPLYMSPQILKQQSYSAKTDIWSLGMLFYEILFGYLPFPARDYYSYMNNVWKMSVKFPIDKQIGHQTKDFILKCLQKVEDERIGWDTIFQHPLLSDENSLNQDTKQNDTEQLAYDFNQTAKQVIFRIQKKALQYYDIDKQLKVWFQEDKQLTKEEFFELLKQIDNEITKEEVEEIFKPIDLSGNDKIDLAEFQKMVVEYDFRDINDQAGRLIYELHEVIVARRLNLLQLFQKYDKDQGGTVDFKEFKTMVNEFFPDLNQQDVQLLFDFFDVNKDKQISFKEFFDTMNVYNNENDVIDQLSQKLINVFQKAGKYIKDYNISMWQVQKGIDDSYMFAANFKGFCKFLRIFDESLTDIELRYAFSNPAFEADYKFQEQLVSFENMNKVLKDPKLIEKNIANMAIQTQYKIKQLKIQKQRSNLNINSEDLNLVFDN